MDAPKIPWTIDTYWTYPRLNATLADVRFHNRGHPRQCTCPWCRTEDSLTQMSRRADLLHGEHCNGYPQCWHQRTIERKETER